MGLGKDRNKPCHCGSEKKNKKCCIRIDERLNEEPDEPSEYIKVPIPYSLVWPTSISFDEYLNRLKTIPAKEAIKLLTLMNIYVSKYEFDQLVQINYADDFLEPIERKKVKRLLSSTSKYVFLIEQQLINLIRLFMFLDGSQEGEFDNYMLGELLLIQNDYNDKTDLKGLQSNPHDTLLSLVVRQLFSGSSSDPHVSTPRNYYLLCEIAKKFKESDNYLDLESEFQHATGLHYLKYASLILAFISKWTVPSDNPEKKLAPINPNTYFNKANITPEEAGMILQDCSKDYDEYKKSIKSEVKDIENAQYDYGTLSKYPLIIIDQEIYPISMRLLRNKVGHYVYWTLFDYFNSKGQEHMERFTRFWGEIYESYVIETLSITNPTLFHNIRKPGKKSEHGEIDILIVEGDSVFIFEVKSSRLNIPVLKSGDIELFNEGMESTIFLPAKQLTRNIEDLMQGEFDIDFDPSQIKKIYPIIVHYYPFPSDFTASSYIQEQINQRGYLQHHLVHDLTLLDVEELEYIIQEFAEHGLAEVLRNKADNYSNESVRNFLYKTSASRILHPELQERFRNIAERIKHELFPNNA